MHDSIHADILGLISSLTLHLRGKCAAPVSKPGGSQAVIGGLLQLLQGGKGVERKILHDVLMW